MPLHKRRHNKTLSARKRLASPEPTVGFLDHSGAPFALQDELTMQWFIGMCFATNMYVLGRLVRYLATVLLDACGRQGNCERSWS
jgi:hypothetical protein